MSFFENLFSGAAAGYGYDELIGRMEERQERTNDMLGYGQVDEEGNLIGNNVRQDLTKYGQFQPWSVRGGNMGSFSQGADGSSTYELSGQQQGQADYMRQGANSMYGKAMGPNQMQNMGMEMSQRAMMDPTQRENDIYGRLRDMQRPGEERQHDSMNAGLFGSGRGGMTSDAYGGSPEQHAFGLAQGEARNQASFQAMNQAQQEMMNYGQMGQQMYGAGQQDRNFQGQMAGQMFGQQYAPMQQLMAMAGQGQQGQQAYGQQQQGLAGMLAQLGIGQATTDVNWGNVQGEMGSGLWKAIGEAAGGIGGFFDELVT